MRRGEEAEKERNECQRMTASMSKKGKEKKNKRGGGKIELRQSHGPTTRNEQARKKRTRSNVLSKSTREKSIQKKGGERLLND